MSRKSTVFDYESGEIIITSSDNAGFSSDGHYITRVGNNMAMDMDCGELHITSSWDDEDD